MSRRNGSQNVLKEGMERKDILGVERVKNYVLFGVKKKP
jgi:hypothetical protein